MGNFFLIKTFRLANDANLSDMQYETKKIVPNFFENKSERSPKKDNKKLNLEIDDINSMNSVDTIERVIARMNTSNLLNQLYHSCSKSTKQTPKNNNQTNHVKSVTGNMGFDQNDDESKENIGDFKSPFPKGFELNERSCMKNKETDKKSVDSEILNPKHNENNQLIKVSSNTHLTETYRLKNDYEVDYNSYHTGKVKSKGSSDRRASGSNSQIKSK